ncbi:Similar to Frequency clock protein; acc. no. Q01115 [Pyronema omphalodes CBS 100304]|uniref:Similar to Frequency clock protein acc. no. Q01115 n=1 Tax=Pyronema omphalodes (strain CBS 100304) TaxID=1076935 RepID=U4L1L8_PYROM|nr:Similar to Frequency clock protein; acc. no. Q01115 [Pyronema omphalodes CBS 100304]
MPNHHRKNYGPGVRHPRPANSHHAGFPNRSAQDSFRDGPVMLERTEESNSDSFRSVIDDLTIKNQKLKRRLRRLEGLYGTGHHTSHAARLFEVRVHDLPEHKKAELEKILRNFTASIDNENGQESTRSGVTPGNRSALDSGYASVSRVGNDGPEGSWASSYNNSELKKMRLVVRRLEQLFTGADATVGDRRVMQQQDISDMAAAEDKEEREKYGAHIDKIGAREASLMSPPTGMGNTIDTGSNESLVMNSDEPEQRPTHPIDLDPSREQIPSDNIEYLTHMTESSTKGGPNTQGGWVYLNLMINMAQLHTINVTPPFIKKAIASVSTKLELSADGRMVRWRGYDGSQTGSSMAGDASSDHSPGPLGNRNVDGKAFQSGSESRSLSCGSRSGSGPGGVGGGPQVQESHKFHYRPIFARSQSFEDDSSSCITSDTDSQEQQKRSSSGESGGTGSKRRDTGPIIFYKGGGFCTDLSSQALRQDEELNEEQPTRYVRATSRPLGSNGSQHPPPPSTKNESPLYQPGSVIPEEDAMEIDRDEAIMQFSPEFPATKHPATVPPAPIEFEASGIGGVLPADNFAINCETKHYILPEQYGRLPVSRSKALKKRILHRIPKSAIEAFHEEASEASELGEASEAGGISGISGVTSLTSPRSPKRRSISHGPGPTTLRHEILSTSTTRLPPSSLPPASYIFSPSEDSSSQGETDEDAPPSSGSENYFFPAIADGYMQTPSGGEGEPISTFQRSPSSAATAGDGSRASSAFGGMPSATGSGSEDQTFEGPLSMDSEQSSSVESGADGISLEGLIAAGLGGLVEQVQMHKLQNEERPTLKRSRGSVISSSSNTQVRKSARMQQRGGDKS